MKFITKYSGVSAVVLLWIAVIGGMIKTDLSLVDDRPISFLGVAPETALYFNTLLFFSAILFAVYGAFHYKNLSLSKWFIVTFLIGQVAQVIAALYQYGGSDKLIHTVAAFTLAAAIPTYMLFFALSAPKNLKSAAYKFYFTELLFFTVGITAFIFARGISPLAEILPALPFHAWILYSTFNYDFKN